MSGGGSDYEHLPMYASSSVTSSSSASSSTRYRLLSNANATSSRTATNLNATTNSHAHDNTHTGTNNLENDADTNYNGIPSGHHPTHSQPQHPHTSVPLGDATSGSHYQYQQPTSNTWTRTRIPRRHSPSLSTSSSPTPRSPDSKWASTSSPFAHINPQALPRLSTIKHTIRHFFKISNLRQVTIHTLKPRHLPTFLLRLLAYLLPGILLSLALMFMFYEPHVEITLYSRKWIRDQVDTVPPLAGCFARPEIEGGYNMTARVWHKTSRWDVQSGVEMKRGMECYDFAGIIGREQYTVEEWQQRHLIKDSTPFAPVHEPQSAWIPPEDRTTYHTYWRTDLVPFGPRQEQMLKSFFATQPLSNSRLILWSNGELSANPLLLAYLRRFPASFSLRRVDVKRLAKGTALEDSERLERKDKKAWVDGDLVRLLVLWNYGGVWVDMDSLLTRDLGPLLEHEFVTQWDCYNKPYTPLNGALMHFHTHSPYLCEAFHIMASSPPPRPGTTDWGSLLYIKLWKRLVRAGIPPFKVLPWCFSDGRSCRIDNRLPDPFKNDGEGQGRWIAGSRSNRPAYSKDGRAKLDNGGKKSSRVMSMEAGGLLDEVLHNVFSVHLHNQWEKEFPKGGWVERLLLRRYEKILQGREREMQNRELERRVGGGNGEPDSEVEVHEVKVQKTEVPLELEARELEPGSTVETPQPKNLNLERRSLP